MTRKIFVILLCMTQVLSFTAGAWSDDRNYSDTNDAPSITTTTLKTGIVNASYSATLSATGTAPITWTHTGGTMPDGLTLSTSGTISGTPSTAGIYAFTVQAENAAGTDTAELAITINEPSSNATAPSITTKALKTSTVSKIYNIALKASGTKPITWTAEKLPDGLTLDDSTGKISGKPEHNGIYSVDITASNSAGSDTKTLALVVKDIAPKIRASLKSGKVDEFYSAAFSTSAGTGNIAWSLDGNLPEGLSFDVDSLTLSGIPSEVWGSNVKLMASNSAGKATKSLKLVIKGVKPSINTRNFPAGIKDESYYASIDVTGTRNITVTVSNLPSGLSYEAGEITGIPEKNGKFNVKITARNAIATVSKTIKLVINAAPEITTATLNNATVGKSYSARLRATGTTPIRWSLVDGELPSGMTLTTAGVIKGKTSSVGEYTFTVGATNAARTTTQEFTLTVQEISSPVRNNGGVGFFREEHSEQVERESPEQGISQGDDEEIIDEGGGSSGQWERGGPTREGDNDGHVGTRTHGIPEEYKISVELPELEFDESGLHELDIILDESVPTGAKLLWFANPVNAEPCDDDEIAEFYDVDGLEIETVPEDRNITVSAWFNEGITYKPVIAIRQE